MSSPFRYFRKHQRAFLAVATVFIVFIFVVGSALSPGSRSRDQERDTQTVATWNGGELSADRLALLVRNRLVTSQFVTALVREGVRAGGDVENLGLPTPLVNSLALGERIPRETLEALALETEVLANLAEQAGITVSDGVVNAVLNELGSRRVKSGDVGAILQMVTGGNGQSAEAAVFSTIKRVLLTYFYQQSFGDAAATILPSQRWEQWLRTNDRVALTAAVIPVDSFVTDVKDPTDAEVADYYEQFKDHEPNELVSDGGVQFPAPNPGFAKPRRVKLAFLHGSVEKRAETLLNAVTDKEIADYYEANKKILYVKTEFDEEGEEGEAAEAEMEEGETEAEMPAEDDEPEAEAEESSAEATTTEPKADADAPAGEADEAKPAGEEGAAARRASPFRLAAFQTEGSEDPAESAEDEPASEGAAEAETEDEAADAEDETPAEESTSSEAVVDEEGEEEEPEYEPLEAVQDEIRRELARQKAIDEVGLDMGKAYEQLRSVFADYRRAVAKAEEEKTDAPELPAVLTDFKAIGEKYGFDFETTAALTFREFVEDTQVGRAIEPVRQSEVVAQAAFGSLEIGEPYQARERLGDAYLVVKVADEPRAVPPLEDVKDKVIAAWKRAEAAKLAEKKAQEIASAAKSGDRSLAEMAADAGYQVINPTDMFAWQSFGLATADQIPAPRLTKVPGLENVGNEFMKKVFELKEGEIGTAVNLNRSAAYVFRVAQRERTPDELKEEFLSTAWNMRDMRIAAPLQLMSQAGATSAQRGINARVGLQIDPEWERQRMEQLQASEQ